MHGLQTLQHLNVNHARRIIETEARREQETREAKAANLRHPEDTTPRGFKAEFYVGGEWGRNGVVWPDRGSAEQAAAQRFARWTAPSDWQVVEVEEEPNRPSWEEFVAGDARFSG